MAVLFTTFLSGQRLVWVVDTIATGHTRNDDRIMLFNADQAFSYSYDTGLVTECQEPWRICKSVGCDIDAPISTKEISPCNSPYFKAFQSKRYVADCYDDRLAFFDYADSTYLYLVESGECHFLGKNVSAVTQNDQYVVVTERETEEVSIYFLEDNRLVDFPLEGWQVHVWDVNKHFIKYSISEKETYGATHGVYDLDFNPIFSVHLNEYQDALFRYGGNADFLYFRGLNLPLRAFYKDKELQLDKEIIDVHTDLDTDFCVVENSNGEFGVMGLDGEIIIPLSYTFAQASYARFSARKAGSQYRVVASDLWLLANNDHALLLDKKGKALIEGPYDHINRIDTNRFVVYVDDKTGIVDSLGNEIIKIDNYNGAIFRYHDYYGVKFISLKKGYGNPGDTYSLFDMAGLKFADWEVETETPRVNSIEFYFRLTLRFLQSLSEDQIKKISRTDVWDVRKYKDGENQLCLVDHTGKELLCGYNYIIKLDHSDHWLVEVEDKKFGLLKVEY
ncbi:MAG: hypothetical protein AAFO03_05975 [Bacteroidota bacterium]